MHYVYTDQGWVVSDEVFTPITHNIKKNTKALPIEENHELTRKFKSELPMVFVRRGFYYIHTVN